MHRRACICKRPRVRQVRAARPIRWLWRVLHDQLDDSPHTLSSPLSRHRDAEVDTCCDAATGGPIAFEADAFVTWLSAELAQSIPSAPMHRGAVASQQSSGPEQQSTCANTANPAGA